MKQTNKRITRLFSLVLLLLVVAATMLTVSCEKQQNDSNTTDTAIESAEQLTITLTVVDEAGESRDFVITTDAKTLGEALIEEGLIEGEEGPYGLYVKKVNGIEADYDKNQAYWSFEMDGKALMTGVDSTPISDGDKFSAVYTRG